ncbi:23789_t:CDS:1, partial [Dentiscutata erythropus]
MIDNNSEILELFSENMEIIPDENAVYDYNNQNNPISKTLLYGLDEVHEVISKYFEVETLIEPVKFIFKIELDQNLLTITSLDQLNLVNENDFKIIENKFRQLANTIIIPLESGSGYYWEICKVYLNSNKKRFSDSGTVYLGCTMCKDRAWKKPDNQLSKRISEIRTPINRYSYEGSIRITIFPENQYAL